MHIHTLDLAIVVSIYLASRARIYFRRGQQDVRDYFLGGRTAPCGPSRSPSSPRKTSTLTIIGTPAIAFAAI